MTITPPPKTGNFTHELRWLVEAAQENERVSADVVVGRSLYSDLGQARTAITRFAQLDLIGAPDENSLCEVNLTNVVALLTHYGEKIPPTAGLTHGTWQLARVQGQGTELQVCSHDRTNTPTVLATIYQTTTSGEDEVNGRAFAALPDLIRLIKEYMSNDACCTEDEPGEGCPCQTCTQGRALLARIYGRQEESL